MRSAESNIDVLVEITQREHERDFKLKQVPSILSFFGCKIQRRSNTHEEKPNASHFNPQAPRAHTHIEHKKKKRNHEEDLIHVMQ